MDRSSSFLGRMGSCALSLVLATGICPAAAFAEAGVANRQNDSVEQTFSLLADEGDVDSGTCGANLTWSLSSYGILTISGKGAMTAYSYASGSDSSVTTAPWGAYASKVRSVIVEEGVTSIGQSAFSGCTSLVAASIASSVTSIAEYAFLGCTSLRSAPIPTSVTYLGGNAFGGCISLPSTSIPSSIRFIGDRAFSGCTSLRSVSIAKCTASIGTSVFGSCTSLASFSVDEGNAYFSSPDGRCLLYEGELVGYANASGSSYEIPSSVSSFGADAFYGCSSLTSITIPEGISSVGQFALRGCSSLESVTIPESVSSIGYYAFKGCTSLTDVYYPGVDRSGITISNGNESLLAATWHYNYTPAVVDCGTCGENLGWTLGSDGVLTISGTGAMDSYAYSQAPWRNYGSSIRSVVIEEGVASVGSQAFCYCPSLVAVDIPSSVTSVGYDAFLMMHTGSTITVATEGQYEEWYGDPHIYTTARTTMLLAGSEPVGSYLTPSILFSEDGKSATAIWHRDGDLKDVVVDSCSVTSRVVSEPTCTKAGITEYTATCGSDEGELPAGRAVASRSDVAALGHSMKEGTCERCGARVALRLLTERVSVLSFTGVEDVGQVGCATYDGQPMVWNATAGCWEIVVDKAPADVTSLLSFDGEGTFAEINGSGSLRGDVNDNGKVNIVDAQLAYDLARSSLDEMSSLASEGWLAADANLDGRLDAQDAFAIQRAIYFGWDAA